jgi:hypothetical protein
MNIFTIEMRMTVSNPCSRGSCSNTRETTTMRLTNPNTHIWLCEPERENTLKHREQ